MALESTIICVDNSEYMRNGDFRPTRLQAQQEAVGYVCQAKIQSHPQNNVGLLTLAHPEVLSTLTSDVARVISKLHQVQPNGDINFVSAVRIAHLVLKHRLGRSHRMRIVVFVGSPVETDLKDLTKLAKSLKKEKVSVDIVNFGEDAANTEKLSAFISTLNGEDGTGSHLVTVPSGDQTHLSDALISSPVIQGEGGAGGIGSGSGGFEFGIDPNEDPELALALRVSIEEQRQQQEAAARRAMAESAMETDEAAHANQAAEPISSEERLLQQALAMSMETETTPTTTAAANLPDFSAMTEEEQIAYAVQMSIQQTETDNAASGEQKSAPAAEAKSEPKPAEKKEEKPEEKKEEKIEEKKEDKKEKKAEDKKGENEGEKNEEKKEDTKEERPEEKKPEQKQVEEAKN